MGCLLGTESISKELIKQVNGCPCWGNWLVLGMWSMEGHMKRSYYSHYGVKREWSNPLMGKNKDDIYDDVLAGTLVEIK